MRAAAPPLGRPPQPARRLAAPEPGSRTLALLRWARGGGRGPHVCGGEEASARRAGLPARGAAATPPRCGQQPPRSGPQHVAPPRARAPAAGRNAKCGQSSRARARGCLPGRRAGDWGALLARVVPGPPHARGTAEPDPETAGPRQVQPSDHAAFQVPQVPPEAPPRPVAEEPGVGLACIWGASPKVTGGNLMLSLDLLLPPRHLPACLLSKSSCRWPVMWPHPFLGRLHCGPDPHNYRRFAVEEPALGFQIGGHSSSVVEGERRKKKGPRRDGRQALGPDQSAETAAVDPSSWRCLSPHLGLVIIPHYDSVHCSKHFMRSNLILTLVQVSHPVRG